MMYKLNDKQSAAFLIASTTASINGDSLIVPVMRCKYPDEASGRTAFLEHLLNQNGDWREAGETFDGASAIPTSASLEDGALTVIPGVDSSKKIGVKTSKVVDQMIPTILGAAGSAEWENANEGAPLSFAQLIHGIDEYRERFSVVMVTVL